MSRTTMSTGDIVFHEPKPKTTSPTSTQHCHLLIIADISGRKSRGLHEPDTLAKRKIQWIDRDNFEDFFSQTNIQLQLPLSDTPIHFREFDDLHPDTLYENITLFDDLRTLQRKLNKPEKFADAAEEIRQWSSYQHNRPAPQTPDTPTTELSMDGLFDNILAQSTTTESDTPEGQLQGMIKEIVAPFVEPKAHPEKGPMLDAVTEATSDLLRKLLHTSAFQSLEATWRSLYLLVRRLETNKDLKIAVLDATKAELTADAIQHADQLNSSQLAQRLIPEAELPGGKPFSLILGDFQLNDNSDDCMLADMLANIALHIGAAAICSGDPKIAGFTQMDNDPQQDYMTDESFNDYWQVFRKTRQSHALLVTSPRFLLRLPYGKKTSPIDSIAFEELPLHNRHAFYLWGNSAYLVTLLIAQTFKQKGGWDLSPGELNTVDNLPIHVYRDEDDDEVITPCAETLMTDTVSKILVERGLCPVRSIKNQNAVIIPFMLSIHEQQTWQGPWS